jgi:hypothetical protein
MPDFDVAAISLASPPSLGALTTYRPAVLVRNNGIHDALASGYVRAYKAGRLVFESEVYSPTIPPGETRQATALAYWTPDAVGSYMFQGFVTAPNDSVPSNNQLAPVTITITAVEPPPPPIVTAHASQHEEDGDDEVSIDGLRGLAADEQHPRDHASNHEAGGDDELSVDGLAGTLATPQPTAAHANEKHTVPFSTVAEMTNHQAATTAHADATNLEKVANKDQPSGYAGLDSNGLLTYPQLPDPASAGVSLNRAQILDTVVLDDADETTILELNAAPAPTSGDTHEIEVSAIVSSAGPNTLKLKVYAAETSGDLDVIAQASLDIAPGTTGQQVFMRCVVSQLGMYNRANGFIIDAMLGPVARMSLLATTYKVVTVAQCFKVTAQLTSGTTTSSDYFYLATIRKTAAST